MPTRYHHVRLGRLDYLNGPSEYPFPSKRAALAFAKNEHACHPSRIVIVKNEHGAVIQRYGARLTRRDKGRPLSA